MAEILAAGPSRLVLLCLIGGLMLGLRFGWLSEWHAEYMQIHFGYGMLLVAFLIWLAAAVKVMRMIGSGPWKSFAADRWGMGAVVFATLLLQVHEPHVLRVLFDETSHVAESLVMHQDKQVLMPGVSHYLGDVFAVGELYPTFRQHFFQFLVSLLHDFTGYRVANVYILNGLLAAGLMVCTYAIGRKVGGRFAGFAAVALLSSLPLLAQNATSGSYDLLNIVLLVLLVWASLELVAAPEEQQVPWIEFGTYTAVLLSLTRYESILYLLPWALLVGAIWLRQKSVRLSAVTIVSPLFLLLNLVSSQVMMAHPESLDPHMRADGVAYFSISYLPDHLSQTVYYLFNPDSGSTNSILLAATGVLGLLFVLVNASRTARVFGSRQVFAWYSVWVGVLYAVVLTQHWSSPVSPEAARFSLPLWWVFAQAGGWLCSEVGLLNRRPLWVVAAAGVWFVVSAAPMESKAVATYTFVTSRNDVWFTEIASRRPKPEVLYVAHSNMSLVANRFASVGLDRLNQDPAMFVRALKAGLYKDVIIFQEEVSDPTTGLWRPHVENILNPNLSLELVAEKRTGLSYRARVWRLVGFREKGQLITPESAAPAVALQTGFKNANDYQKYILSLYPR